MSTTGQALGGIAGAIVGSFFGNPILGAQIGLTIGGILDPVVTKFQGPRLEDKREAVAEYGAPISRIHGKVVPPTSTWVWIENGERKEVIKKEKEGGKGGPTQETTTYTYFVTGAVLLTDHECADVLKIGAGSDLLANPASNDAGTLVSFTRTDETGSVYFTFQNGGSCRVYLGTDDQEPDTRYEADVGVGNAPAFRGCCYAVFYDFPLEKYGNSIAGVRPWFELISDTSAQSLTLLDTLLVDAALDVAAGSQTPRLWWVDGLDAEVLHYGTVSGSPGILIHAVNGSGQVIIGSYSSGPSIALPIGRSDTSVRFTDNMQPYTTLVTGNPALGSFIKSGNYFFSQQGASVYDVDTGTVAVTITSGYGWPSIADDYLYVCESTVSSTKNVKVYDIATDTLDRTISISGCPGAAVTKYAFHEGVHYIYCGSVEKLAAFQEGDSAATLYDLPDINFSDSLYNQIQFSGHVLTRLVTSVADDQWELTRWRLPYNDSSGKSLSTIVSEECQRSRYISASDIDVTALTDTVSGYRMAGTQALRSILAPLQQAFRFDYIQDGYQIKFIPRGQSSVMTIDPDDFIGDVAFPYEREMDSQMPRKVLVKYLDALRNYDNNQQESPIREGSEAVNVEEYAWPIVKTADDAAQDAEILWAAAWQERTSYGPLTLPPTYRALQPCDVITVPMSYGTFELRIDHIEYMADGAIKLQCKQHDATDWASSAVGDAGNELPANIIPYSGQATAFFLDIPMIRDADDQLGFAVALSGGNFVGASLYQSTDGGITYNLIGAANAPVTMGYVSNVPADNDGAMIDRSGTLSVDLLAGTLSSITEAQMMTGLHWYAHGVDGRWVIGRFVNATLESDGSYTLDTLLRGLRGTEQYNGDHTTYDQWVYLDDPDIIIVGMETSQIGVELLYKVVPYGKSLADVTAVAFTYNGVNKECLSPYDVRGSIDGSNNWNFTWIERSRYTTSWWTTGVERVNEPVESYEIDVMNGSTVVRTITASTNAAQYTSAQQVTDFGSNQTTITIRVYQLSATVGRGYVTGVTL